MLLPVVITPLVNVNNPDKVPLLDSVRPAALLIVSPPILEAFPLIVWAELPLKTKVVLVKAMAPLLVSAP